MIDTTRPVEVYWNKHRNCFSVRQRGKVVAYAVNLVLNDVKFVVSKAGQDRCRRTGKRNVHAFIRGNVETVLHDGKIPRITAHADHTRLYIKKAGADTPVGTIWYNPFTDEGFLSKLGIVTRAKWCVMGAIPGSIRHAVRPRPSVIAELGTQEEEQR